MALPETESPPSNEQVSSQWIEQFNQFQEELELFQIVRNKLYYRFQTLDEMVHVLESICGTLHLLDETHSHQYFVQYVRAIFDQYFLASNTLKLGYVNLLVVAHKKELEPNQGDKWTKRCYTWLASLAQHTKIQVPHSLLAMDCPVKTPFMYILIYLILNAKADFFFP